MASIKDTTANPVSVYNSGAVNPFQNVEVQGGFQTTWDAIYGAGGDLKITLTSPGGVTNLGTLSDPNNVLGTSGYKFDPATNTFTEHTYGGPQIGPLSYVRDAVHGLLYTAPNLAPWETLTVQATISFTETQWDGLTDFPTPTHGTLVTVTDPAPVILQVGGKGPTTGPIQIGVGPDSFTLNVSEDAYQGDAQFIIKVDGKQYGGTQTASSFHGAGESQPFIVNGTFGPGVHSYTVNFLNDAWSGSDATDRNLYVNSASYNGYTFPDSSVSLFTAGSAGKFFNPLVIDGPTIGSGPDTFKFAVSEDAYQGDAQFVIDIDGKQYGSVQTTTALHHAGQTQNIYVKGDFGGGASSHTAAITFLNDAWGGSNANDRNLFADLVSFNDSALGISPNKGSLFNNGTLSFVRPGTGVDTGKIIVSLTEDFYKIDAQALITVDGQIRTQVAVTAPHNGTPQAVEITGISAGPHTVGVTFVNDEWGGTDTTDRNLYVAGISYNGVNHPEATANLFNAGTATFNV